MFLQISNPHFSNSNPGFSYYTMLPVVTVVDDVVVSCHYDSALLRLELELSPKRNIQYTE